ncbi:hypothetical protein KAR91_73000 [Candidatus Pacearchaeota archaeon]|nr:hypothetical protein [Candidatus Pacearchaeota archaeon]
MVVIFIVAALILIEVIRQVDILGWNFNSSYAAAMAVLPGYFGLWGLS